MGLAPPRISQIIGSWIDYVTFDKIIDHYKSIMTSYLRISNLTIVFSLVSMIIFTPCVVALNQTPSAESALSQAAHSYVHLGLELGQYDQDYVDAYLGPKEWQEQATKPRSKEKLAAAAKRRAEAKTEKDSQKPGNDRSKLTKEAVPKPDYVPTSKKSPFTQRRSGG